MALIVPDNTLEVLLCSQCKKYLSVLPVKVYKNNLIRCGRCCGYNDGGVRSLYENFIKNSLFKCVNRYDGCRKILKTTDVCKHEENCQPTMHKCQEIDCCYSGSAFEIIQHYSNSHPQNVIKSNEIDLDISEFDVKTTKVKTWLFILNEADIVAIVITKIHPNADYVEVVAQTMRDYENIKQSFSVVSYGEISEITSTEIKPCLSVKYSNEMFVCNIRDLVSKTKIRLIVNIDISDTNIFPYELPSFVEDEEPDQTQLQEDLSPVLLTKKFSKIYPGYRLSSCNSALISCSKVRIELLCSNCGDYMGYHIFSCTNKHYTCYDCSDFCAICDNSDINYDPLTSMKSRLLLFFCKWKCGEYFTAKELHKHESNCDCCIIKCPKCEVFYTRHELKQHSEIEHDVYITNIKDISKTLVKNKQFLFLSEKHGCIFEFMRSTFMDLKVLETPDDKIRLQMIIRSVTGQITGKLHVRKRGWSCIPYENNLKFYIRKIQINKNDKSDTKQK